MFHLNAHSIWDNVLSKKCPPPQIWQSTQMKYQNSNHPLTVVGGGGSEVCTQCLCHKTCPKIFQKTFSITVFFSSNFNRILVQKLMETYLIKYILFLCTKSFWYNILANKFTIFCSQISLKNAKNSTLQNSFWRVIIFHVFITQQKYIYYQASPYHVCKKTHKILSVDRN